MKGKSEFGDTFCAWLQSMILIEIEDTMAQPPSEVKSMKRATHTGIAVTVSSSFQLIKVHHPIRK